MSSEPASKILKMESSSSPRPASPTAPTSLSAKLEKTSIELKALSQMRYYVDRTKFIRTFMDWKAPNDDKTLKTLFISAPYSFGKTHNLKILETFYEHGEEFREVAESYKAKFGSELEIMKTEHENFRNEHMGKYLVLRFDFKDMASKNDEQVQNSIIEAAYMAALKHEQRLMNSKKDEIKKLLKSRATIEKNLKPIFSSGIGQSLVESLTQFAESEGKVGCLVLIDEFDGLAEQLLNHALNGKDDADLKELSSSYASFISNITDDSKVFKCLAVGRTRYGSAASSKCKKIVYSDFLESAEFAAGFGLARKQVNELLTRRMIKQLCGEDAEKFKSLLLESEQETFDSALRAQFPDIDMDSRIEDKGNLLKKMETYFNGFIVRGTTEKIFFFSSVIYCLSNNDEFDFEFECGSSVGTFSKGLSLLDFGLTVLDSYRKKELIPFRPKNKLVIKDLQRIATGLNEGGIISTFPESLNVYKQYIQELGFFTKIQVNGEWKMEVPNQHILKSLEKLIDLVDFCANATFVSLQQSILQLESDQSVNEDSAEKFLSAFSNAFSKVFQQVKRVCGGKVSEYNLQAYIYYLLHHCFMQSDKAIEIRIPLHVQNGFDECNIREATNTERCGCNGQFDKRVDVAVDLGTTIIILELKVDKTAKEAVVQMRNNGYFEIRKLRQFAGMQKSLIAIGMNYSNSSDLIEAIFLFNPSDAMGAEALQVYTCSTKSRGFY